MNFNAPPFRLFQLLAAREHDSKGSAHILRWHPTYTLHVFSVPQAKRPQDFLRFKNNTTGSKIVKVVSQKWRP
jgi:hypothetical protein